MKKIVRAFCIAIAVMLCTFSVFEHTLAGHWVSHDGAPGAKILLDFNEDSTFKVTVNNQIENKGRYKFYQDTFWMYDNNCGMQNAGMYKIIFLPPILYHLN